MKNSIKIIVVVFLVFNLIDLNAQRGKSLQKGSQSITAITAEDIQPFNQGNLKFSLSNPLNLQFGSNKYDGDKTSSYSDFRIRGQGTYFVADGIGIGGNIDIERDKSTNEQNSDFVSKDSEFMIGVHGVYGQQVGNINGYVQPSISIGSYKSEYEYTGFSSEFKEGIFRVGIKVGALVPLGGDNSNVFFSPYAGWRYTKYTEDDNSSNFSTTSKLFVGGGLTAIIPTKNIPCDCNTNFENVSQRLDEGSNIFEFNNKIRFSNYSYKDENKDEFSGIVSKDEDSQVDFKFGVAYKRAVLDGLFAGVDLYINADKYDYEEDPSYTYSGFDFNFGPTVEYYPFEQTKLSNALVGSSLTFGSSKNKSDDNGNTNETKYSRLSFDLHVGYDYGVTPNISIVPQLGYEVNQSKNKDSDIKSSSGGMYLGAVTRIRVDW